MVETLPSHVEQAGAFLWSLKEIDCGTIRTRLSNREWLRIFLTANADRRP